MIKEELILAINDFCNYAFINAKNKPSGKTDEEKEKALTEKLQKLISTIQEINLSVQRGQDSYSKWDVKLDEIQVPKILAGFVEPYSVKFMDNDDCIELLIPTPRSKFTTCSTYDEYCKLLNACCKHMFGDNQPEMASLASLRRKLIFNDAYIYAEYGSNVDGKTVYKCRKMTTGYLPLTLKSFTKDFFEQDEFSFDAENAVTRYIRNLFTS